MRRRLAAVTCLALAGAAVWWVVRAERVAPEYPREPVSVRISEATLVVRHQGVKQAEIDADRVEVSADHRTATFTGRTRTVLFAGDAPRLVATGGRIIYDRATQALRVEGGLRISSNDGATLTARTATWDALSQVVELAGDVEVTFPVGRHP